MVEEINGPTTTAHHFHYDGNGNVTETTDLNGDPAATYRYDAFGNTLVATGSYALTNRYRFSTKPLDSEVTNAPLYYYAYRYYDPVTGRWPSRDPIGERGGVNLYGFNYNSPVDRFDDLGHESRTQREANRNTRNQANQEGRRNNQNAATTEEIANRANNNNRKGQNAGEAIGEEAIEQLGSLSQEQAEKLAKEKCDELLKESNCTKGCRSCKWSIHGVQAVQGGAAGVVQWYVSGADVKCKSCSDRLGDELKSALENPGPSMSSVDQNWVNPAHNKIQNKYSIKHGPKTGCKNG
jgi:RHS repeat-associated protein